MVDLGSEEWLATLARRAEATAVDPSLRVVVQQELLDSDRRWHVVVADGRVRVAAGSHPAPDVTFAQDRATGAAIAAGELSAQQAFADGRLRVRGAVGRLAAAASAFAALGR